MDDSYKPLLLYFLAPSTEDFLEIHTKIFPTNKHGGFLENYWETP